MQARDEDSIWPLRTTDDASDFVSRFGDNQRTQKFDSHVRRLE